MKIKILFPILIIIALGIFPIKISIHEAFHCIQNDDTCPKEMTRSSAYRHILSIEPWRVDLWEALAETEMENENWQEAVNAFQSAIENHSISTNGRSQMGFALLNAGQEDTALQLWIKLIENGQASQAIYEELLPRLLSNLEIETAETVLTYWTAVEPENARVQLQFGLIKLLRSHEEAVQILETAADLDGALKPAVNEILRAITLAQLTDDPAYQQLTIARAVANQGYPLHAELLCAQSVQLNPGYAEAWAFLGEMQQQNGRDGLSALETAFSLDPDSLLTRSLLAIYWQRQQEPLKAIEIFSKFAEEYPDQLIWQTELAKATAQSGDIPAGLEILTTALQNAPENDAFVAIELANYCAVYRTELSTIGLPSARQALLIEGNTLRALSAMGNVLFSLNDLDSAQRYYQTALEIEPNEPTTLYQLGMIAYQQDEYDDARYYFNSVLSNALSNSEIYAAAQRMLENF